MTFTQLVGVLFLCIVVNGVSSWLARRQENALRRLMRDSLSEQIEALELVQPILADLARFDPSIEEPLEVAGLQVRHQLERMRFFRDVFADRPSVWRSLRAVRGMRVISERQRQERGDDS